MTSISKDGNSVTEAAIQTELARFDWSSARWTHDKLHAASPFRYDRHPSFVVFLDSGNWTDMGADDPDWRSGNFTKLLAFLDGVTYDEAAEYLRLTYAPDSDDSEVIRLLPRTLSNLQQEYRPITLSSLERYNGAEACPYLTGRCVSPEVQRMMRIGYDMERKAVVIPWFNADGTLGNVKFRKVAEKTFWYAKGGRPIREMLYGIDVIYRRNVRRACVVEAEIDAMTLMSAGMAAVATGGATFTEDKRRLIVQSPLEEIVIVRDNDRAGRRWRNDIYETLRKDIRISFATVPLGVKDPNEYAQAYGVDALRTTMLRRLRHIATLSGGLGDKM